MSGLSGSGEPSGGGAASSWVAGLSVKLEVSEKDVACCLENLPPGFGSVVSDLMSVVALDEGVAAKWVELAARIRPFFPNREAMMNEKVTLALTGLVLLSVTPGLYQAYHKGKDYFPAKKHRTPEQQEACDLHDKATAYVRRVVARITDHCYKPPSLPKMERSKKVESAAKSSSSSAAGGGKYIDGEAAEGSKRAMKKAKRKAEAIDSDEEEDLDADSTGSGISRRGSDFDQQFAAMVGDGIVPSRARKGSVYIGGGGGGGGGGGEDELEEQELEEYKRNKFLNKTHAAQWVFEGEAVYAVTSQLYAAAQPLHGPLKELAEKELAEESGHAKPDTLLQRTYNFINNIGVVFMANGKLSPAALAGGK